ncbi:hypothetical protein QUF90_22885 [Desulfococcaceae bacterium HSG9]|nr:hypothetical protein [Desulfococcaceae bacterium HSG9]
MKAITPKLVVCFCIYSVSIISCTNERVNVVTYDISGLSFGDKNVTGWGKLRWGMPFDDVAEIYKLSAWKMQARQFYCVLINSDFSIGKGISTVAVAFFNRPDQDGKLIKIKLVNISKKPSEISFKKSSVRFYLDDLIRTYGKPDRITRKSESGRHVYFFWEKPSGRIDAKLIQFDYPDNKTSFLFNIEFYSDEALPSL